VSSIFLVAECDADIRTLIRDDLEGMGYRVETAATLAEATAVMGRVEPDVVLAAEDMGGDHGYDLLRVARDNGYEIPLILLVDAARDDPGGIVVRFGAMTYLKKPVNRRRLAMLARLALELKASMVRESNRVGELSLMASYLNSLLNASGEAVFVLDEQGAVLKASERGIAQFGGVSASILGRQYLSLLTGASSRSQGEAMALARAVLLPQRVEDIQGDVVFETVIRPVLDKESLSGFIVVARDITARRRMEAELEDGERLYRSVYEAAPAAIMMIDRNDGSILDCNEVARKLYGYGREAMLGMGMADLAEEPESIMEAVRAGAGRIPVTRHRKKGGTVFPVEISMSHFVYGGREVCTAFIQDISHRKVVEEALREGARLYRAVVEDQTELICRYTPDGALSFVNGAYAKFFGVDEDEIVGRQFFPALADDERRDLRSWIKEAGAGKPVFDREQRVTRGDGQPRWILWTNRAVLDHRGAVKEIQAVGRDITERKEAEHALSLATVQKEQYRLNLEATFRSIPDAIVTVDSELRVITTNSAAGTLLGIDRERAAGTDFAELMPGQGNACLSVLKQVLRTSRSVHGYEAESVVPGLGVRMVELNCTPLIDQEKRHSGAVLVVRDISRIADLEKRLQERQGFRGIIGRSSAMQDIYRLLEQLSSLDSTVIILGESGTGKELVAEALHYGGSRAASPLIKVNCSALTESLLESELFGHVRGAFTGAIRDKVGRIQAAEGGTLFLDEIGDISPLIQLKLLRFLEQKEYERVGESRTYSADVRIIAATNADLREIVRQGAFREDLYYRLNVMPVSLPPLRERQADIPLLVDHFLEIFAGQFGKTFSAVSGEVMDLFMSYDWHGNIRELRHTLEHACILSPGGEVQLRHMRRDFVDQMLGSQSAAPIFAGTADAPPAAFPRKAGRQEILAELDRCSGNKARAARRLGIHRATLYRKLKAWGLED
jgi:PAS domain S-box-containing protein